MGCVFACLMLTGVDTSVDGVEYSSAFLLLFLAFSFVAVADGSAGATAFEFRITSSAFC